MPSPDDVTALLPLPEATYHILVALADENRHGYDILREVQERTDGQVRLHTGTLYTTLHRLLRQKLVATVEESSDAGSSRRGSTYEITDLGRQVVRADALRLQRMLRLASDKNLLGAGRGN